MKSSFVVVVLLLAAIAQERSDLGRYTKCRFTSDFQIVQTDRLPRPMSRSIEAKAGNKAVHMLDGYRVLITYAQEEPFVNMKVEQLAPSSFSADKQALIENLGVIASQSQGMESTKPEERRVGPFESYGIDRKQLEGGVLSIYTLFNDGQHTVTTIYFLNADPTERKFHTVEAYRKLRDDFLTQYGACAADASK